MMKLEDFVRSKREEADLFIPSDNLWKQLEAQLPAPQKKVHLAKIRLGSRTGLLLGFGLFLGEK